MYVDYEFEQWLKTEYIPMGGGSPDADGELGVVNDGEPGEQSDKSNEDNNPQSGEPVVNNGESVESDKEDYRFDEDAYMRQSTDPEELVQERERNQQLQEQINQLQEQLQGSAKTNQTDDPVDAVLAKYNIDPGWKNLLKELAGAVKGSGKELPDVGKVVETKLQESFSAREMDNLKKELKSNIDYFENKYDRASGLKVLDRLAELENKYGAKIYDKKTPDGKFEIVDRLCKESHFSRLTGSRAKGNENFNKSEKRDRQMPGGSTPVMGTTNAKVPAKFDDVKSHVEAMFRASHADE